MTRLAGLIVLSALALPANASNPTQARQKKPRPTQSAEPPLAVPLPNPAGQPALPDRRRTDQVTMADHLPSRPRGGGVPSVLDEQPAECANLTNGSNGAIGP